MREELDGLCHGAEAEWSRVKAATWEPWLSRAFNEMEDNMNTGYQWCNEDCRVWMVKWACHISVEAEVDFIEDSSQ